MKTKQPYDKELAMRNIIERARWQSRNLRIKKSPDEIESLVLPSLDILAELREIEKKEQRITKKILT